MIYLYLIALISTSRLLSAYQWIATDKEPSKGYVHLFENKKKRMEKDRFNNGSMSRIKFLLYFHISLLLKNL